MPIALPLFPSAHSDECIVTVHRAVDGLLLLLYYTRFHIEIGSCSLGSLLIASWEIQ